MRSNDIISWLPTASAEVLRQRAAIIQTIRTFFSDRNVLEVETPLLSASTIPDPNIESLRTQTQINGGNAQTLYLQTSPEFHMKRLLAANSGSIYQITKAFRDGEAGRLHNPEFSMLEWYRPGFDHWQLMHEVAELLQLILHCPEPEYTSYADLFSQKFDMNPHEATAAQLAVLTQQQGLGEIKGLSLDDKDAWLDVLLTHCIEPELGKTTPTFVYDYPASQAALAKIKNQEYPVAERFEVYIKGIELANGFHELTDHNEQTARFHENLAERRNNQQHLPPIDEHFIMALQSGMPSCAGVALGIDRLVMLALNKQSVADVLSFSISNS